MEEFMEELSVGMRFSIIHRFFRRQMDELLSERNLTGPQLGILGQLYRLGKSGTEVNQRDLENACHLSHTTVTELLKRLEKKGFVESRQSDSDRRSKCITATKKAELLHEELFALDARVYENLCEGLTPEQRESIAPVMDTMLQNVMKHLGKGSNLKE